MDNEKNLLLASQSPRRRELLGWLGFPFESMAADVDERLLPDETPAEYVTRLAETKARACAEPGDDSCAGRVVIGSDTAVVDAGETLGKPGDAREAELMLRQLRGRTHQVYTGIAIYEVESDRVVRDLCVSDVPMREYDEEEMRAYIQTGDPLDKAGAYAIQNDEFAPVENFSGCFASVMGLPLCHLARNLKEAGMPVAVNLPAVCKASLNYACSISAAVLRGEEIG